MRVLHLVGMHGMGDTLHERAVVRHYIEQGAAVWLETSWPQIFHDLVGPQLHLVPKASNLRTQTKNATEYRALYSRAPVPGRAEVVNISYRPDAVRLYGSVLRAMLHCSGVPFTATDFRLPLNPEWPVPVEIIAAAQGRPIMVYRPLVKRNEWGGCDARNPDFDAYRALFESIRERYFVVSVADLVPRVEWIAGHPVQADLEFHAGELSFEMLAGLVAAASLTFASPGFLTILAQSVGVPSVCVFGGYESGTSFLSGRQWAPHLPIQPITPCSCFRHDHPCQKAIDMPAALEALKAFPA